MAMNQQTAQLILELVDNASASLKNSQKQVTKLKKEVDSLNKSSTKAEKGSERLGTSFNKTGKQAQSLSSRFKTVGKAAQRLFFIYETGIRILRAAQQFFVEPFIDAGKAASDFAAKLAEINTLFDKGVRNSSERVAFLGEAIKNVSINMGQDLLKTADSAYNAVSAGATDAATAQKLLENATKLSVAGLVETDVAMKALTTVSNSFGRSLGSSEKVSDLLFTTVQKGVTTMGELAPKIGRVSGVAAASGMSMEAMFAVLAAGTKITGNTSRAVTGLGSAINLILKPGKDAEETLALVNSRLKGYQIDIGASAVQNGNMISTLQAMAKAFKEGKLGADELAKIIPNQRAQAVVLGIVKEGAQEVADIYKKMSDEGIVAGATQAALNKQMQTSQFQTKRFKSALQGARTELGNLFEKSGFTKGFFQGMADELQNLKRAFDASDEGVVDNTESWSNWGRATMRAIGGVVLAVKTLVEIIGGIFTAIESIITMGQQMIMMSLDYLVNEIPLRAKIMMNALNQALLNGLNVLATSDMLPDFINDFFIGFDQAKFPSLTEKLKKEREGFDKELDLFQFGFDRQQNFLEERQKKAGDTIAQILSSASTGFVALMAGDLAKIETVTNKSLGLDKKTTTRTPPPPPKVAYELKTKEAKEAAAFFAEIFAGQQADFQQALLDAGTQFAVDPVTRDLISDVTSMFPGLPLEGLTRAAQQTFDVPLPELPLEGVQDSVDAFKNLYGFAFLDTANEAQFAANVMGEAFRKMAPEPSTVEGLVELEKKIDAIVSIIAKLSKEDLNKVLAGGVEGAQKILTQQLKNATEAAELRDKLAADIAKRNLARRGKQAKRDEKREKKANKEAIAAAKKRAQEIEQFAQSAASTITNLGSSLIQDLINDEVSVEQAFKNLGAQILEMIAMSLAEFVIAEGIKAALLGGTATAAVAADQVRLASGLATDAALTKSAAGLGAARGVSGGVGGVGGGGLLSGLASSGAAGAVGLGALGALFAGGIAFLIGRSIKRDREIRQAEVLRNQGYGAQLFSKGGLVTGGIPGRDSVSALLTPGEYVLNKPTVDAIRAGKPPSTPGRYANGGMVTARGGAPQVVFAPNIQTLALPTSVQNQKYLRDTVSKSQAKLARSGLKV